MSVALAKTVEIDGRPALIKILPPEQRESRILEMLQTIEDAFGKIPNWREAFAVSRDVEAMRRAAEVYKTSINVQIRAGEVSIRCGYELGKALQTAFPESNKRQIADETSIPYQTVCAVMQLSTATWSRVNKALGSIKSVGHVPTASMIAFIFRSGFATYTEALAASKAKLAMREPEIEIRGAKTDVDRIYDSISNLRRRVSLAKSIASELLAIEQADVLASAEARSDYARFLLSYRELRRTVRHLSAFMRLSKERTIPAWDAERESARNRRLVSTARMNRECNSLTEAEKWERQCAAVAAIDRRLRQTVDVAAPSVQGDEK